MKDLQNIKMAKNWAKVCFIFFYKAFMWYITFKIIAMLIILIERFIVGDKYNFDSLYSVSLCFGIYMAFNTTYLFDGKKFIFWNKIFKPVSINTEEK